MAKKHEDGGDSDRSACSVVSGPSWTCPQCTWRRCTSRPLLSGTCVWNWYSPSMVWYVIFVFQRVLFCCFLERSHLWIAKKGSNLKQTRQVVIYFRSSEATTFALFLYQFNHFDTQDLFIKNSSKPGDLIIFECHTSRPQQCCFFSLDHRGQLATATWSPRCDRNRLPWMVMKAVRYQICAC